MEVTFATKFNARCEQLYYQDSKRYKTGREFVTDHLKAMEDLFKKAELQNSTNKYDKDLSHRHAVMVRAADIVVEAMRMAGAFGVPLGNIIEEKLNYEAGKGTT